MSKRDSKAIPSWPPKPNMANRIVRHRRHRVKQLILHPSTYRIKTAHPKSLNSGKKQRTLAAYHKGLTKRCSLDALQVEPTENGNSCGVTRAVPDSDTHFGVPIALQSSQSRFILRPQLALVMKSMKTHLNYIVKIPKKPASCGIQKANQVRTKI